MSELFPRQPAADPRVHICQDCKRPNAPCGIGGQWWCVGCVHPSFWIKNRGAA